MFLPKSRWPFWVDTFILLHVDKLSTFLKFLDFHRGILDCRREHESCLCCFVYIILDLWWPSYICTWADHKSSWLHRVIQKSSFYFWKRFHLWNLDKPANNERRWHCQVKLTQALTANNHLLATTSFNMFVPFSKTYKASHPTFDLISSLTSDPILRYSICLDIWSNVLSNVRSDIQCKI